jgi:transcriptional regulator GlxA family with amidase domain
VDALKRFRPAVEVDGDAIHVEDRGIWTSAGVTAGMDLALAMIEADHGRTVSLAIARRHVIFRIRPGGQSQFSAELAAQSAFGNAKVRKLAERVTEVPGSDWRVDALAAEAAVSQRSLSRLFRRSLNLSPAEFVERVRVDVARRQLLDTDRNVESIALDCGFGSLRRMDRAFARTISVSPTEFRSRFKTNGVRACRASASALSFSPS